MSKEILVPEFVGHRDQGIIIYADGTYHFISYDEHRNVTKIHYALWRIMHNDIIQCSHNDGRTWEDLMPGSLQDNKFKEKIMSALLDREVDNIILS